MLNKADMPNWNKFVNEVLSGKYKGSEKKLNEDDNLQHRSDAVQKETRFGADKENTVQS